MAVGDNVKCGYAAFVGTGREATWGTKVTATSFLEFNSESLEKKQDSEIIKSINSGRTPTHRVLKSENVTGSIETYLNVASDAVVSLFIQAMGGSCTTVGTSTSGAVHTINQGYMTGTCQALTLQKRPGDSGAIFDYVGCRVNSWSIKAEPGGPTTVKFDLVGKYGTTSSDSLTAAGGLTVALTEINPLHWSGISFTTGNPASMTNVLVSGTSEVITGLEITYNNGLVSDDTARNIGSLNLGVLPPTEAQITVKVTQRYDTSTTLDRAFGESATAIGIHFGSRTTIGALAGSTTYSMALTFPKCYLVTTQPKVSGKGPVMLEHTYEVIAPSAGAAPITMSIVNGTNQYA